MPNDNNPAGGLAPVEHGTLEVIARAEIDQQIATAHRYPRKLSDFKRRATEMACLDEETAASCIYSRPVGKKKDEKTGKWVEAFAEGMSIRMAEIVGASFGNLRVGAMIVEQTPRYVKARGFAHDLETNFASTTEVIESTVDKDGNPYSERMRIVVAKATVAKARRDATFNVVPRALCKPIEDAARKAAIGDATTLTKRRAVVMAWIGKLGIDPARVFAALNVAGEADIGLEQLTTLTGIRTAIKDGDATVDESFPPLAAGQQTLPPLSDADFEKSLAKWKPLIEGGKKSAADVIATAETKNVLSDEQRKAINAIKASSDDKTEKAK